eukprot:6213240-Pleurochrysis_carterae.AAC.3
MLTPLSRRVAHAGAARVVHVDAHPSARARQPHSPPAASRGRFDPAARFRRAAPPRGWGELRGGPPRRRAARQ